jgi:hypothetical protein
VPGYHHSPPCLNVNVQNADEELSDSEHNSNNEDVKNLTEKEEKSSVGKIKTVDK